MNSDDTAIKGFDPVTFFNNKLPEKGRVEFSHIWSGKQWYFSTPENRDLFSDSPEKYAPQFEGYCAWAVAHGYTADGDPEVWKIVDGKLYLNYDRQVKLKWEAEQRELIQAGEKHWEEFKTNKPAHMG